MILIVLFSVGLSKTGAQSQEAKQLLLDVQKLASLKNILTDLKKGYEIISGGYNAIKNISEGNFNLHNTFLNSLLEVSPTVRRYKRIADVISAQLSLVKEYKSANKNFNTSNLFNPDELGYFSNVYNNLFNQSVKNLEALGTVITSGRLRMSDDERLSAIDDTWNEAQNELMFLRHFNNSTKILALQRAKEHNDVFAMNQLFNVNR
jgi:DNA repair ATPase RecN